MGQVVRLVRCVCLPEIRGTDVGRDRPSACEFCTGDEPIRSLLWRAGAKFCGVRLPEKPEEPKEDRVLRLAVNTNSSHSVTPSMNSLVRVSAKDVPATCGDSCSSGNATSPTSVGRERVHPFIHTMPVWFPEDQAERSTIKVEVLAT